MTSSAVRQFEFHPTVPGLMLAGRKDGLVMVLDYDLDKRMQTLQVDSFPVLGVAWLQSQPQWAVVGTSQCGTLRLVKYDGVSQSMGSHRLESFSHLSSLSANCTDDFLTTSGFCIDIGIYDIIRGSRIGTFTGLHQNFTNTTRFAHRSPHLFATASFDHTCKVWDIRQPVTAEKAAVSSRRIR
jgi:WD40 repeat protein